MNESNVPSRRHRWVVLGCMLLVLILLVSGYFLFFSGYRAVIRRYVSGRGSMSGTRYCEIVPDTFLSKLSSKYSMNRKETGLSGRLFPICQRADGRTILVPILNSPMNGMRRLHIRMMKPFPEYETKLSEQYNVTMSLDKVVLANVRISTTGDNRNITDSITLTLFKSGTKWYCMDAMEQVEYACEYDGYDLW